MDIGVGTFYKNKTWYYLMPTLRGHGEILRKKLSSVFKFACGVHDELLSGSSITNGSLIYILTDKKYRPSVWQKFIDWVRYEEYYVTDYPYGPDLETRKHMLVLTIPHEYENTYSMFLEGRYSQMYTKEQQERLFDEDSKNSMAYKVLSASPLASVHLRKAIKLEYDSVDFPENPIEYDLPLRRAQEVFNCNYLETEHPLCITSKEEIL